MDQMTDLLNALTVSICTICEKNTVGPFSITPILDLGDGEYGSCCKTCADKEFPGWEIDDE